MVRMVLPYGGIMSGVTPHDRHSILLKSDHCDGIALTSS